MEEIVKMDESILGGFEKEAGSALAIAQGITAITTPDMYAQAGEHIKGFKLLIKKIDDTRKEMTRPLDALKKKWIAFFDKPLNQVTEAKQSLDRLLLSYEQEQERKRQAEQAKLDEKARIEKEKALTKAEELRAQGKTEKAEVLEQKAETTIAPVAVTVIPKVEGLARKTLWKYRIKDINLIPREYMIPNEVMLGQVARATKGTLPIAGIEFYEEKSNI